MTKGEIEFIEDLNNLHHCEHNTEVSKSIMNKPNCSASYLGEYEGANESTAIANTNAILKKPNLSMWKPRKLSYHCERQEQVAKPKKFKRN
mmetsp:Transcript_18392/g.20568  ORF Transcript_18392/g.20568 Transcript_18392/m.20568 type:complete len:91 (-) Transcript_18392:714-986(-)